MSDLFPINDTGPYEQSHRPIASMGTVKHREVAKYDYLDEEGNFLYQVVRTEPKGFYQRTKDTTKTYKDGWVPGLRDIRRVLFRLPEIAKSNPSVPVLVVEGEEDVLAAERLGLLATTNVGGTGMGWRPEYSLSLQGRRVVVIADNDAPGYRHAEFVVGSLIRHSVASVRLVGLPGVPERGDLRDWIKTVQGEPRSELARIIRQHAEYRPSPNG